MGFFNKKKEESIKKKVLRNVSGDEFLNLENGTYYVWFSDYRKLEMERLLDKGYINIVEVLGCKLIPDDRFSIVVKVFDTLNHDISYNDKIAYWKLINSYLDNNQLEPALKLANRGFCIADYHDNIKEISAPTLCLMNDLLSQHVDITKLFTRDMSDSDIFTMLNEKSRKLFNKHMKMDKIINTFL